MNNPSLSIQPLFPLWVIVLGTGVALTLLVWKEIAGKSRFLGARIVASIFMVGSIVALVMQPTSTFQKESVGAILLTRNYIRSKADSLVQKYPELVVLRVNEAADFKNALVLQSYELPDYEMEIVFILGDGLPAHDEKNIRGPYTFIPGKLPYGIAELMIPERMYVGQAATISGSVNISGGATLVLKGPARTEDSVIVQGNGLKSFAMSFQPKQEGLFQYALVVRDSLAGETKATLPVEIKPEEKLNILFVQNYPTADVRYLKNFLAEKGHAIAMRTQISKSDFRYEFSNQEPFRVDRLNAELLKTVDLVFLNSESLNRLNTSDMKDLEHACNEGLGIIILINSTDKNKIPLLNASVTTYAQDTVRLKGASASFVLPTAPVSVITPSTIPIVASSNRVLSGFMNLGAGKVGFQLLHESYRLLLEGKKNEYANLWSPLMEATTRLKLQRFQIQLENQFPYYTDEPLLIRVIAGTEEPELKDEGILLPLQEDGIVDDYWQTTTWAGKSGWHHLGTQDSTRLNYFVSTHDEWLTLRIANQHKRHLSKSTSYSGRTKRDVHFATKPISPVLFFIIFLLASGFLWLAPKL